MMLTANGGRMEKYPGHNAYNILYILLVPNIQNCWHQNILKAKSAEKVYKFCRWSDFKYWWRKLGLNWLMY